MRLRGLEPTKKRTLLPFFPKHLIYAIHALLDLAALIRREEDRIPESFFCWGSSYMRETDSDKKEGKKSF